MNSAISAMHRITAEVVELNEKIEKLRGFMNSQSNEFSLLAREQQELMRKQSVVMQEYRSILLKRIALMATSRAGKDDSGTSD